MGDSADIGSSERGMDIRRRWALAGRSKQEQAGLHPRPARSTPCRIPLRADRRPFPTAAAFLTAMRVLVESNSRGNNRIGGGLENPFRQPLSQCRAEIMASQQLIREQPLGRQYFLGCLSRHGYDQGFRHSPQPPPRSDAVELPLCAAAVGTGGDRACIGAAFDLAEQGVIEPVQHLFHRSTQRREIFRADKQITASGAEMRRGHFLTANLQSGPTRPSGGGGRHSFAGPGAAVPDDQKWRCRHSVVLRAGLSIVKGRSLPLRPGYD